MQPGIHMNKLATLMFSAAMFAVTSGGAVAACVQAGSTVTCSGSSSTGFGSGGQNSLTVTVQPEASIATGPGTIAIDLADGNTVTNNGAIIVGAAGTGVQVNSNNVITNAGAVSSSAQQSTGIYVAQDNNIVVNSGTITLSGTGSFGVIAAGSGNTIQNLGAIMVGGSTPGAIDSAGVLLYANNNFNNIGAITSTGMSGVGVDAFGDGSTITNGGSITATGPNGIALLIEGINSTVVNSGMVKGGTNGFSLLSFSTTGATITNNGTLDGRIFFPSVANSLTNAGLIIISDPGTALSPANFGFGGAFTQTAQGTLALRADSAGNYDAFQADTANINGTLRVVLQKGLYQSTTTYTGVLVAGSGVTGQFASVTASSAFINAAATYNATSVDLTLTRIGFGNVTGESANQRSVGNALEAGYSTGLSGMAATFYSNLLQSGSVRVLDQLSGEGTSGTENTAFAAGAQFGQSMDGQMDAWRLGNRGSDAGAGAIGYAEERPVTSAFAALKAPPLAQPQWHAWASGFGAAQSLSGNAATGSAGFSDRVAGGAAGVDHLLNPDLLVGLAVGGSSASFNVNDLATSGKVDGAHVGAYAMQRFGGAYVSAQLAYSHFNNSTTRSITGIGTEEVAKGSFGSEQLGGRLEVGRRLDFASFAVTPFAALQAAQLWQAGYTESSVAGAGPGVLGLSYAARSVSSLPLFLGTKFDGRFAFGNGMTWMPFANVAWVHEFEPSRNITATLIAMPAPAFTVEGARAASDAGRIELGSRLALNRSTELSGRFTGEFSRVGQSYAGMGSLRLSW